MNISGIYAIINIANDKLYIGSAKNFSERQNEHFRKLRYGKHVNKHLQSSYDKYKDKNFIFVKLEYCEKEKLIEREQWWIDNLKPEYNKRPTANNQIGFKHSEKTLAIFRQRDMTQLHIKSANLRRGSKASEETKKKMSLAHKGKPKRSGHAENVKLSWIKRKEKTLLNLKIENEISLNAND